MKQFLLLSAAMLALAVSASAQVPEGEFSLAMVDPGELNPDGPSEIAFNLTIGCAEVLENAPEAEFVVGLASGPEWFLVTSQTIHVEAADCLGQSSIERNGTLHVDATQGPGLVHFEATFNASIGSHVQEAPLDDLHIGYLPGHTLSLNGDQTFEVDGPTHEFDLVVEIQANAKTMVMFEEKVVSGTASLSGLKAHIFDVAGGERSLTNNIVFTAPTEPWEQETVSFYNYSHCLDAEGCTDQLPQRITWTFVNVGEQPAGEEMDDESKDSPGLLAGVVLVAVVGLAAAKRRW